MGADKPVPDGVRVIHVDDLKVLLEDAAERGARNFAASIGLTDDAEEHANVAEDIRAMRSWLAAWRVAKRTAWQTFVSWSIKLILAALLVGFAVKLGLKIPPDAN